MLKRRKECVVFGGSSCGNFDSCVVIKDGQLLALYSVRGECEQWCSGTGRGTLNVSSGAVVLAGEH